MTHWTRENLERVTREYLGDDDGSPQARKRARILAAATRLFMERGYKKTSIDEVAQAARVAKGTVYLYYPSKAQLLVHAVALEKTALMARFAPLLDGTVPPADRLRRYLEIVFASVTELPLSTKLMSRDAELLEALHDLGDDELAKQRAIGRGWISELIELAAPGRFSAEERDARAEIVIGVQFFALQLLSPEARGALPLDRYQPLLAEVLAAGLAPTGPSPTHAVTQAVASRAEDTRSEDTQAIAPQSRRLGSKRATRKATRSP
ncbi:MAG: TetR/AcrR family transcriptional regulator [Sandaracinaceae bacterium]|nr:TetR/AcrR family transcriptional regulator [Sandaracinaceae bacterium]